MHRLGEIRDRGLENQSYRASGLTLLTAAISLWNTVYIERAIDSLRRKGIPLNEQLIAHLSPLGWEHINLSGDYVWRTNLKLGQGKYRSLRSVDSSLYKNSLSVGYCPFSNRTPTCADAHKSPFLTGTKTHAKREGYARSPDFSATLDFWCYATSNEPCLLHGI
ncbi:transposase [Klebsiella pneumoniae]|nr:transposase [Klebsiella pneumoniae]STT63024.1 transposase [Klebsiella pneumoniae]STT97157.1 transposase [Klebsiella pneumoniae]STT97255.1 transposase [Klebsiella pneumoniae]